MERLVNGKPGEWPERVERLWKEKVLFGDGETCERANWFTPRPFVDEYNQGSKTEGFVYTVNPGRRVAVREWTACFPGQKTCVVCGKPYQIHPSLGVMTCMNERCGQRARP